MTDVSSEEINDLAAFVGTYMTYVGIDPSNPVHVSHTIRWSFENLGRKKAFRGLRQAADDAIAGVVEFTPAELLGFETALKAAGLESASSYLARFSKRFESLLDRARIRTETEFYLANGVLSDRCDTLSASDRVRLEKMVAEYRAVV